MHSHYWAEGKALIDPLLPDEPEPLLAELRERGVDVIVLSNRHHWRSASEVQKAFPEVTVLCNDQGLYEFTDDEERWVEPYAYGASVAPGLKALEFAAICDDDAALLRHPGRRAALRRRRGRVERRAGVRARLPARP